MSITADTPSGEQLPDSADIVIIGGGVGGASIAYHLAELGCRDVLLLDRDELTSGSTFHSAGMVGQLRSDPTLTRMNMYSVELYRALQAGDNPPSWVENGSIRLASSPERMSELLRQLAWARSFGLPMERISAAEAALLFPLMSTERVLGGVFLPSDGHLDPSQLCYSLTAGARKGGVQIHQHTRVLAIQVDRDRVRGLRTDRGDITCRVVVNAAGMFAAEVGRLADVRIPIVPMSHQYLLTERLLPDEIAALPSLRDPDLLVYFRQEGRGLLMGGYERHARPFATTGNSYDAIPADFNGRLLGEDWERFEEITANSQIRVPAMATVGLKQIINGPEAFTPDNEFCLGQTAVDGLFVSAGFCAHGIAGAGGVGRLMAEWIVGGEPTMDVSHMDINRFGRQYRSPAFTMAKTLENYQTYYDIRYPGDERSAARLLRRSSAFAWHKANGASFGEKSGWERVNFYNSHSELGDGDLRPRGWAGRNFSTAVEVEHLATRNTATLFDESSFAKIDISGKDAAALLEWVCDNKVARGVGQVTYTQMLNSRGGIEADVTVTRLEADAFVMITGTASGSRDISWLRRQARSRGFNVRISDISGGLACFALWGPQAREILQPLTPTDLSHSAFAFMTSQELTVGDAPARALRVTYVGELGWELYVPAEYGAYVWELLVANGSARGMVVGGYRAIESLRLEKAYRAWGSDLTGETNPLEAGLGFCVSWDKPFLGRDALVAVRENGVTRALSCLTLSDPRTVVLGGEPVSIDGRVVARVTSGGYGYTVGRSIAFAYLPIGQAGPGTECIVDVFGDLTSAVVVRQPLYDPKGARIRM